MTVLDPAGRRIYLAGLLSTWGDRDVRYWSRRSVPLSKEQVAVVIAWRRREAVVLEEPERGLALSAIQDWSPP